MRPLVKVCGLRRPADAELALELGARYLGCVLASDSPRCATLAEAVQIRRLAASAKNEAELVLVFRDSTPRQIVAAAQLSGARRVQLHGAREGTADAVREAGLLVHPVQAVDRGADALPQPATPPTREEPALLDVGAGGTGRRFPWRLLGGASPPATFIAGGIDPDNVNELLFHRPFGIDVSSGVEQLPGRKDPARLRGLFAAAGYPA
ncbi:MAG: phosphoribosylanthranilate isomerase [Planctomycetota bacterium]